MRLSLNPSNSLPVEQAKNTTSGKDVKVLIGKIAIMQLLLRQMIIWQNAWYILIYVVLGSDQGNKLISHEIT